MKSNLTRRQFLKSTALATGAISTGMLLPRSSFARRAAGDKLNCVQIGCGGRGLSSHIDWLVTQSKDNLVAIVDQNGYQIVGPGRELNLRLPEKLGDQNDPNTVNEIQFPVEKV